MNILNIYLFSNMPRKARPKIPTCRIMARQHLMTCKKPRRQKMVTWHFDTLLM
jgi:hypothetical protein